MRGKFLLFVAATAAVLAAASAFLEEPQKIVEVLVVLDKTGYKKWNVHADRAGNTVEDEIISMMYEVSLIYRKLGVDIRIKGDKPVFLNEDVLPLSGVYNRDWYNSIEALVGFKDYMMARDQYYFDVAVFLAGYNLALGDFDGAEGRAYDTTACTRMGVGIVENLYDMRQIIAIAHEIGHNLASMHDGDGNNCNDADGYIMTSATETSHSNFITWSSCSSQYIWDFMASDKGWCFKESETYKSSPIKAERFGKMVGGEEVCHRREGVTSYVSRVSEKKYPVCQTVLCETQFSVNIDTWSSRSNGHFTPQGMPCGSKSSCDLGKCVYDNTVDSKVDENCLFGDTPYLINSMYTSCAEAFLKGACKIYDIVRKACCQTCKLA